MTLVFAGFLLGFLGSAHCIGMCGPFVVGIGRMGSAGGRPVVTQAGYYLGKTFTYSIMGAVAGGASAVILTMLDGVQRGLSLALGLMLVFTGAVLILKWRPFPSIERRLFSRLGDAMGALVRRRGVPSAVSLGALNGLLPCGLVYGAVILAATSGSVPFGAAVMVAFGLGTVPALVLVAAGSEWLLRTRWRDSLVRAGGVLILLVGLMTMARGSELMDRLMHHHENDNAGTEIDGSRHRHSHH
jgi:uncharacterized protein